MSPYVYAVRCSRKRCAQYPQCTHAKVHEYDGTQCETIYGFVTGKVVCPACVKVRQKKDV